MSKIILIGGGKLLDEKLKWVINEVPENSKILVIPSFSKNDQKWFEIIKNLFEEKTSFIDLVKLNNDKWVNELKNYNVLFVTGGKPDLILKKLFPFKDSIKKWSEKNIFIGISAGALVAGRKCVITPDENYDKLSVLDGLNLINDSVEVHFNKDKLKMLNELGFKILGLGDYSAVILKEEKMKIKGEVHEIF